MSEGKRRLTGKEEGGGLGEHKQRVGALERRHFGQDVGVGEGEELEEVGSKFFDVPQGFLH